MTFHYLIDRHELVQNRIRAFIRWWSNISIEVPCDADVGGICSDTDSGARGQPLDDRTGYIAAPASRLSVRNADGIAMAIDAFEGIHDILIRK
jgi:hypothetical protein